MTSERRFEQDLPGLLDDLYMGPMPAYRDHVLHHTARARQRPAWSFPERWLPMVDVARQPVLAPRVPWRSIGLAAILIALLVAAAAVFIGSQPRLPAPFGLARSGLIAYDADGDIYTADPATGVATAIIAGSTTDIGPRFSRDGANVVFERKVPGRPSGQLYVSRVDGQGLVNVTTDPRVGLANYAFSPDGLEIMFTSGPQQETELWIAKTDGSEVSQLDVGMSVVNPTYRPPNGAEIVFAGGQPIEAGSGLYASGLYAVEVATGQVRTILAPASGVGRDFARFSPDGSRIAYSAWTADLDRNTYRVHVVAADGSGDKTLPMPDGATFQDAPAFSNDGRHLAIVRGYGVRNENVALAVVPSSGDGVGVETARGLTGCCDTIYEWAPDDTSILVKPFDLNGRPLPPLLWDPLTGATRPAPWPAISDPAWQRLAP